MLSLPVFQAVKQYDRDIHVTALIAPGNAEFARHIESIDEIIIDDKHSSYKLIREIRTVKPDISLTLYSTFRIGMILFLSGIQKRIAPATKLAQIFHNATLLQRRSKCHKREYEYNLDLLKEIDNKINLSFSRPVIPVNKREREDALEEFKVQHNIQGDYVYIAFHPGFGGSSIGNMTVDEYVDIAETVSRYKKCKVVYTFGPDEADLMEEVRRKVDYDAVFFMSDQGVSRFCQLISNFALFVSTSTGTMHLAGAVNIPTMSFFGDERVASPKRWATLNEYEKQINITIPDGDDQREDAVKDTKGTLVTFLDKNTAD